MTHRFHLQRYRGLSWLCALVLGALAVNPHAARPEPHAPAPSSTHVVTLGESRVYSLFDLAAILRKQTGTEVYVDRRQSDRRVFLSKGRYSLLPLLAGLRIATGLVLRKMENGYFLGPSDPWYNNRLAFPILPPATLARLKAALRPIGEHALDGAAVPFPVQDFLTGKRLALNQMSPAQRRFISDTVGAPTGNPSYILGSSYLLCDVVFAPATAAGTPNDVMALGTVQIYYDYRDRLVPGESLPEH